MNDFLCQNVAVLTSVNGLQYSEKYKTLTKTRKKEMGKLKAALLTLGFSSIAGLFIGVGHASAATITWSGGDCPATNCNWSNTNNWVGGVAPVSGDSVVINASSSTPDAAESTDMDIPGLTLAGITTSGYSNASGTPYTMDIVLGQDLTLSGPVTHTLATAAAPSGWNKATELVIGNANVLTISGTVTMLNTHLSTTTLNLGGGTLNYTYDNTGIYTTTLSIEPQITGNGTLTIDVPTSQAFFMNDTNNYTGTTNLTSLDYTDSLGDNTKIFGTSTINISSKARILLAPSLTTATISNTINVTPPTVTGTFLTNQIEFWSQSGATTFTAPNIHLLGNARFGVNQTNGAVTVNLAGITANGHCVQYGDNNSEAANFQNGPASCVVSVAASAAPAAPNTGRKLLQTNTLLALVGTLLASASIVYMTRKVARK